MTPAKSAVPTLTRGTTATSRSDSERASLSEPAIDTSHLARAPSQQASDPYANSELLATLRQVVKAAAEEELAGSGWTAADCPWFEYWFGYYERRPMSALEAAIRRWTGAANAANSTDYLAPVERKVREAIRSWRATGAVEAPIELPAGETLASAFGDGAPLASDVRTRMEHALDTSLADVRIHTGDVGARAASGQGARAVAVGSHVAFAQGQYNPGTDMGDLLLAHELAHTAQQRGASEGSGDLGALESEADDAAVSGLARLWNGARGLASSAWQAVRLSSVGLRLQRCDFAKAPPDLATMSVRDKAVWISKAMDDDKGLAEREIAKVFVSVKSPAEFLELQKYLNMQSVLEYEDNFGAAMIGAVGPVTQGQSILNAKRVSFIEEYTAYSPVIAEVLVNYVFQKMYDDDMRVVLTTLAEHKQLANTIGRMPSVKAVIAARKLDLANYVDRDATTKDFLKAVGSTLRDAVKAPATTDNEANHHFYSVEYYGKLLPSTYQEALDDAVTAAWQAAADETPKRVATGLFDHITGGVPHAIWSMAVDTPKGVYHFAKGDYDEAGRELTGALVMLVAHASVKAYSGIRSQADALKAGKAVLTVESEAMANRLLDKLGPERVGKAASYVQARSETAAFVAQNGEAGVRAIDRAAGNLANAKTMLPQMQAELAAELAAEKKAAEAAAAKRAAEAEARRAAEAKAKADKDAADDVARAKKKAEKRADRKDAKEKAAQAKPADDAAKAAAKQKAIDDAAKAKAAAARQKALDDAARAKAAAEKKAAEDAAKAAAEKKAADDAAKAKAAAEKKAVEDAAKAVAEKKTLDDAAKAAAAAEKKAVEDAAKKRAADEAAKSTAAPAENKHPSGLTRAEFVAEYKRRHKYTLYSEAELEAFYDSERFIINPQSGLLNDLDAGSYGPPQHRADYVRGPDNKQLINKMPRNQVPADLETGAQLLALERDAHLKVAADARRRRDAVVRDETAEAKKARVERETRINNEALHQARLASQKLGEDAAEQFGKQFEGGGRTKHKGKGAGDFDFSYTGSDDAVIIEAKGGESGLGSRYGTDSKTRVEQGTRAYAEAVIEDIVERDRVRALQLSKALESGKLKYYVVRQSVDPVTGALGPIEIQEFKL